MDLNLLKMRCKDSKQHHVMIHELYSVSSLLCIAQNVPFEIPYKVLYSSSSRKRPPREFRKVVATRAGRLREWALVSDHMMKP